METPEKIAHRHMFSRCLRNHLVTRDHSKEWQAVHSLLHRAWWKHMWIVQETVVAKRIRLFCDSRTLGPLHFSRFLDILLGYVVMYMPLLS